MLRNALESGLVRTLVRRADTRAFPMVVASVAVVATLSMSVPFAGLLVAAVLMAPRRWVAIALWSSLGAALGGSILYLVFHHLGWARLFAAYPDVVRSVAWQDATRWLSMYGVASLLVIAALPLPLTPALMFAAISRLPVAEVVLALWVGKLAKYLVYAALASAFPSLWIARPWPPDDPECRARARRTGASAIRSSMKPSPTRAVSPRCPTCSINRNPRETPP